MDFVGIEGKLLACGEADTDFNLVPPYRNSLNAIPVNYIGGLDMSQRRLATLKVRIKLPKSGLAKPKNQI